MTHFPYEEWEKYIKNELNEDVREKLEDHLYSCDQCLDIYLQAVTEHENELPIISIESDFTDRIMTEIGKMKEAEPDLEPARKAGQPIPIDEGRKKAKPFYDTAVFHYFLAAAMTLLLMATGVFQSITNYTDKVRTTHIQEKQPSVTEGIMDKTFAWMDNFDAKIKEANNE